MHQNNEKSVYVSGMVITEFKRNVIHLIDNAKNQKFEGKHYRNEYILIF